MKKQDKELAISLRQKGLSVNEITKILKVSKGSVSVWVRSVELTDEQKNKLKEKGQSYGNTHAADHFRKLRCTYQDDGVELYKKYGYEFLCGCLMYWCEGTKNKGHVSLINTDPYLIKYFIGFLEKFFGVTKDDFVIHCTYYDGADIDEIEKYWSEILETPLDNFHKSTKVSSLRKNYKYGMARVMVYDVKIVQAIYGAIQYVGGFKKR